jgi:RNA-directed DNA polymerase
MQAPFFDKLEKESDSIIRKFFNSKSPRDILETLEYQYSKYFFFRFHFSRVRNMPVYESFSIRKKSGGERIILSPNYGLKEVQSRLNSLLQIAIKPKNCAHGFLKSRSIVTNAKNHLNKNYIINFDIENYFPSIHFGRVKGLFMSTPFNFNNETASFIANMCCFEGILPQGAPTSPIISNLISRSLDNDLLALCIQNRSIYSRYADDITISTSLQKLPEAIGEINSEGKFHLSKSIEEIIKRNGFKINIKKTRISNRYQSQIVTGLKVNKTLNVNRSFVRNIRAMLNNWRKSDLNTVQIILNEKYNHGNNGMPNRDFIKVLRGKLGFLGSIKGVDDLVYKKLLETAKSIDSTFRVSKEIKRYGKNQIVVYTEGKTDWKHLKKALVNLKEKGKFQSLDLVFKEWNDNDLIGSDELLNMCRTSSKMRDNKALIIFLFDNDTPDLTKKIIDIGSTHKYWDNNVYSAVLVNPDFKRDPNNICIEHFYSDNDLKTEDSDGRRIYLSGEFDKKTLRHLQNPNLSCVMQPKALKMEYAIIDDKVYNEKSVNVALSKEGFAKNILNEVGNFKDLNFDQFKLIFDQIEHIEKLHSDMTAIKL